MKTSHVYFCFGSQASHSLHVDVSFPPPNPVVAESPVPGTPAFRKRNVYYSCNHRLVPSESPGRETLRRMKGGKFLMKQAPILSS